MDPEIFSDVPQVSPCGDNACSLDNSSRRVVLSQPVKVDSAWHANCTHRPTHFGIRARRQRHDARHGCGQRVIAHAITISSHQQQQWLAG
jgi:hypothetical protein